MKLKLLSHNVRGLNNPAAVENFRHYLVRNPVDLLFIQEHKLRALGASRLGKTLWKRATYFFTEVEPGYNANATGVGKGGVATFIAPRWANLISQTGSLFGGRVQWLILSGLPGGDIGFANVYAPTDPNPCKALWETLACELPSSCRWILLGDFNMVERRVDKSGASSRTLSAPERLLFNGLKDSLHISEVPLTLPNLSFSWDNARIGNSRIMAKLDRVYVFNELLENPRKILEYCIKGDHSRSDHSPVTFTLKLAPSPSRPSRWIMSSRHLDDAASDIRRIWTTAPPHAIVLSLQT